MQSTWTTKPHYLDKVWSNTHTRQNLIGKVSQDFEAGAEHKHKRQQSAKMCVKRTTATLE